VNKERSQRVKDLESYWRYVIKECELVNKFARFPPSRMYA
ncbi:6564_t:CDS:1, partial [Dentiscutata erythropus]